MRLNPSLDENGEMRDNFAARFRKAFNSGFSTLINKYKHGVLLFIKHKWLMWSTLGLAFAALILLMNSTKTGLVPDEDQGVVFVNVSTAAGSSLRTTDDVMKRIEERMEQIPQVKHVQKVAGYGLLAGQGSSFGMCIIKLKDWEERPDKADAVNAVIGQIYGRTADIKDAQIFAVAPPMISGYGTSTGFSMHLQDKSDGSLTDFYNIYLQFIGAEPAPGDRTRLLDLQHQLPAVCRKHRRGEGQTGRHLAQRDPFDAFGLLRRAVRLERQPFLENVLRNDPVRPEIPS